MESALTTKTKYFTAVADNKRIDAGLRIYELRIDDFRKKAINRIWKAKYDLLDELVLLNVKTPECSEKTATSTSNRLDMRHLSLDENLFSSKPVSFGQKKSKTPMAPVIEVNGTEAICYPNPDSKRGRHVHLDIRTSRRIEAAKIHTTALFNVDQARIQRERTISELHHRNSFGVGRPFTAPKIRKPGIPQANKRLLNRPKTSAGFSLHH